MNGYVYSQLALDSVLSEINRPQGFLLNYNHIKWAITSQLLLGPLGAVYDYKLFWALPIVAFFKFRTSKRYLDAMIIAAMVFFTVAQFALGIDTTRYFGLMFPAIHFAAVDYGNITAPKRLYWDFMQTKGT